MPSADPAPVRAPTWATTVTARGARVQTGSQSVPVQTSRVRHVVTEDCADLSLLYANWNGGESPGPGEVSVRASLEVGAALHTVFFRGQRTAVLSPGGWVQSDPLGVVAAAGDVVWVRTTRTLGGSGAPNTIALRASTGEGRSDADQVDGGAVTAVSDEGTPAFGPLSLLAGSGGTRGVALFGDSISNGLGEAVREDGGYLARTLGDDIGVLRLNGASGTALVYANPATTNAASGRRRLALSSAAVHAWCEYGINDLSAPDSTLEQVRTSLVRLWTALDRRGMDVRQSTITPSTSSTDGWTTADGQRPFEAHPARIALNAWIRSTPAPLVGFFEAADAVETARDSGLWRPGLTADGVHPTTEGHQRIAAALRPAAVAAFGGRAATPGAVTGLVVSEVTSTSLLLSWDAVPGATGYDVRHRRTGEESWATSPAPAGPPARLTGLAPGAEHELQVRTVVAGAAGEWSAALLTTTPPAEVVELPTAGLLGRWDAGALVGVADGDPVASLPDGVGGVALLAPSAARRPRFRAAQGGSRACLAFDGVDDLMDAPGVQIMGPSTEFVVYRLTAVPRAGQNAAVLSTPSSSTTSTRRQVYARGTTAGAEVVATAGTVLVTAVPADTDRRVLGVRFLVDGGRQGTVRAGGAQTTGALGTNARAGLRIGATSSGSAPAAVEIFEVLVYGPLDEATWDQVHRHLAQKHLAT